MPKRLDLADVQEGDGEGDSGGEEVGEAHARAREALERLAATSPGVGECLVLVEVDDGIACPAGELFQVPKHGTLCGMLKGQDIVVLVELLAVEPDWTIRGLGDAVGLAAGPVHRSLGRLAESGLYDARRRRVIVGATEEFLLHGLRFVFPARPQGEVRGDATAWAAPPLKELLASSDPLPPVWPAADGSVRGLALEPLHPGAVFAARRNTATAERLALLDAIRAGDARVRGLAAEQLRLRLEPTTVAA